MGALGEDCGILGKCLKLYCKDCCGKCIKRTVNAAKGCATCLCGDALFPREIQNADQSDLEDQEGGVEAPLAENPGFQPGQPGQPEGYKFTGLSFRRRRCLTNLK